MKTTHKLVLSLSFIALWGCFSFRQPASKTTFGFVKWRSTLLSQFDSLTTKDSKKTWTPSDYIEIRKVNLSQIRGVINLVDSISFQKMLTVVLSQNKLKSWNRMYYVYSFHEGEAEVITSTFIFYSSEKKSWSITYSHSGKQGFYKAGNPAESALNKISERFDIYKDNFFVISKFDDHLNCLYNKIIVGGERDNKDYPMIQELIDPQ